MNTLTRRWAPMFDHKDGSTHSAFSLFILMLPVSTSSTKLVKHKPVEKAD